MWVGGSGDHTAERLRLDREHLAVARNCANLEHIEQV
jgi:hypothetical protein